MNGLVRCDVVKCERNIALGFKYEISYVNGVKRVIAKQKVKGKKRIQSKKTMVHKILKLGDETSFDDMMYMYIDMTYIYIDTILIQHIET